MTILLIVLIVAQVILYVHQMHQKNKTIEQWRTNCHDLDLRLIDVQVRTDSLVSENSMLESHLRLIESQVDSRIVAEVDSAMAEWTANQAKAIRADAVKRSQFVQNGLVSEHQVPWQLPGVSPKDFRFVGGTIDMLAFWRLSDYDNEEDIHVLLIDVKTGQAKVNQRQRLIRNAIQAGRVSFILYYPETGKLKEYPCQDHSGTTLAKSLASCALSVELDKQNQEENKESDTRSGNATAIAET